MQNATGNIVITSADRSRLENAILADKNSDRNPSWNLEVLRQELARASVVPAEKVPNDVVTMNSTVQVRRPGHASATFTIVYPDQADVDSDCISILSPMGLALLGARVGEEVQWSTPAGPRRYIVENLLYQPEAACRWDL